MVCKQKLIMEYQMNNLATQEIDELDRAIIKELKKDGRQPARTIANALNASAVTVRSRIKSLEEQGIVKVIAVTDFGAAGFDVLLAIGIEIERRKAEEVGQEFAKFQEVLAVNLTTGANDLELLVAVPDFSTLSEFMEKRIGSVDGVGRMSSAIMLDVFKYQSETEVIQ